MKKSHLAFIFIFTTTTAVVSYANRKRGTGNDTNKGRTEIKTAIDSALRAGTGKKDTGLDEISNTSRSQEFFNLMSEKGIFNPHKITEVKKELKTISDARLKEKIDQVLSKVSNQIKENKTPLSRETQSLLKSGVDFILSLKGIGKQFKTSTTESIKTKEALEALLEVIPDAMKWDLGKQKNLETLMKTIVKGKEDLITALNKALNDAQITLEELIKRCKG